MASRRDTPRAEYYVIFRDSPAMSDAGYATLTGQWYIGRWWPNRGPHYISGVADCEPIAGPFNTHAEAVFALGAIRELAPVHGLGVALELIRQDKKLVSPG